MRFLFKEIGSIRIEFYTFCIWLNWFENIFCTYLNRKVELFSIFNIKILKVFCCIWRYSCKGVLYHNCTIFHSIWTFSTIYDKATGSICQFDYLYILKRHLKRNCNKVMLSYRWWLNRSKHHLFLIYPSCQHDKARITEKFILRMICNFKKHKLSGNRQYQYVIGMIRIF